MAFTYTLTNAAVTGTDPAGTDLISLGDDNIRNFKSAIIERANSRFVDVNADPWIMKSPAGGSGNVQSVIPVSDNLYTLGEAARRWSDVRAVLATIGTLSTTTSTVGTLSVGGNATVISNLFIGDATRYISPSGTSLVIGTGSATRVTIDNTGATTFVANVTAPNFVGTLLTAAQPNITSLGTLTSLIVGTAAGGQLMSNPSSGTNAAYFRFKNTSGWIDWGLVGSAPNFIFAGDLAYASVLGTQTATALQFGTSGSIRQTIDSAGNVVFTGTVTAANFVGPTSINANNLTGDTLAAGVIHSSLKDLGVLTALNASGTITLTGAFPQIVINASGHAVIDLHSFDNSTLGILRFYQGVTLRGQFSADSAGISSNVSVTAPSFIGNLTGTVLTAVQANITSLGTLTSLTVAGNVQADSGITVNGGAFATGKIYKSATTGLSLGTITGSLYDFGVFSPGGSDVFYIPTGTVNVRFAGTVTFDGTALSNKTANAILQATGQATTSRLYIQLGNTSGSTTYGVESSVGGTLFTNAPAYATVIGSQTNTALSLGTNAIERLRIDGAGAVTANGAWTFNSTIAGVTTLTATSIFGTLSTASQTNITAVGTLGSLTVTGTTTSGAFSGPLTGNVTGTILTAAQANITSLGTLTGLSLNGDVTLSAVTTKVIVGTSGIVFRDSTDTVTRMVVGGAGASVDVSLNAGSLRINTVQDRLGSQLLSDRRTGWGAPTGTATRTGFPTSTVTLPLLAERVKALIDDLTTHGVIGA